MAKSKAIKYPIVYEMRRDGWNDYWRMSIYKNNAELLRGLKDEGIDDGTDNTLALVHPTATYTKEKEHGDFSSSMFATLFLSLDNLGSEVLCHESVHIGMAHERFVEWFGMAYGDQCGKNEERLAYYIGSVFSGIVTTLRENKHIE
jgi:hypothetical protein